MQAQEMIKALENKFNNMRKDLSGLAVALDQLKAAFVAEAQAAADGVASAAPRLTEMLTPEFKERIRAEFLAEAAAPRMHRKGNRMWTIEAKRQILHEYRAAQELSRRDPKQRGAVKRVLGKHGISSAHLVQWRDQVKVAARPRMS